MSVAALSARVSASRSSAAVSTRSSAGSTRDCPTPSVSAPRVPALAAALDAGATSLTAAVAAALPTPSHTARLRHSARRLRGAARSARRAAAPEIHLDDHRGRAAPRRRTMVARSPSARSTGLCWRYRATEVAALSGRGGAGGRGTSRQRYPRVVRVVRSRSARRVRRCRRTPGFWWPPEKTLAAKAFTLSSRKWPHLAERDVALARASFGRFGDDALLSASDEQLVTLARADLADRDRSRATSRWRRYVQRWHGGLPQYRVRAQRCRGAIEAAARTSTDSKSPARCCTASASRHASRRRTTAATRLAARVAG